MTFKIVIVLVMAIYGVVGLCVPQLLMRLGRPFPGRNSWVLGGAFYANELRTRTTSGVFLAIAVLGFALIMGS
jgi:hypothetical protein